MTSLEFLINMDFFEQQQKKRVGNYKMYFLYVCYSCATKQKKNKKRFSTDHYLTGYISEKK